MGWNKTKQRGESEPQHREKTVISMQSPQQVQIPKTKIDSSKKGALVLGPQGSRVLRTPPLAFPLRLTLLPAMKNLQPRKSVEILGLWPPC